MSSPLLEALRQAHRTGRVIEAVPPQWQPASLDEAYAIAAGLTASHGAVTGWKIGATAPPAQRFLGLREPFFGRILADGLQHTPARIEPGARTLALEPEIAFLIATDLAPRDEPYVLDEVRAAVGALVPAIEVCWPPYARPFEVGAYCLVAANGVNAGVVLGAAQALPDDDALLDVTVALSVDGVETARGRCAEALGPPLSALAWLANALRVRGGGLRRGEIVCAGALTRPAELPSGHTVRADFGPLGRVEAQLAG
jgi:2-oxo-hept-3-ene-1,7-dioate hydratase